MGRKDGPVQDRCPERGGLGAFRRAGLQPQRTAPQEPRGCPHPRPRGAPLPPAPREVPRPRSLPSRQRGAPLSRSGGGCGTACLLQKAPPTNSFFWLPPLESSSWAAVGGLSVSMEIEGAAASPGSGHYSRIKAGHRPVPQHPLALDTKGQAGAAGCGGTCPGAPPDSHRPPAPAGVADARKGGKGKYFSILEILMLARRN